MTDRTKDQMFADKLDCELFLLIGWAEAQALTDKHWLKVAEGLKAVRPLVRKRMSAKDRSTTI